MEGLVFVDGWEGAGETVCEGLNESTFYPVLPHFRKSIAFGRFVVIR
jgi:hypothetical protein